MDGMRNAMATVLPISLGIFLIGLLPAAYSDTASERTAGEAPSLDDRIDALVQQLAHPSFQSRESARWELQKIGLPAFEKLREAITHTNVEIAASARYLIHSFKVVWWLESDSLAVRQLLRDYDDLPSIDCISRMQQLAEQRSADGYQALVRLARYESHEQLSKSAAICLMETYLNPRARLNRADLANWIRQGLAGSSRTSAKWLLEFAKVLQDERADAEAWRLFASEEHILVASNSPASSEQIASRLYKWIGQWLAQTGRRELALELARPGLELASNQYSLILSGAHWALDANLPELVEELARNNPDLFSSHAQCRYLLAESFLKTNKLDAAKQTASEASDLVGRILRRLQNLRGAQSPDNEALERVTMHAKLLDRGLFDWAEAELLRALKLEISPESEMMVRQYLADFYWDAGVNDLAAKVWEPAYKKAQEQPDYADQLRRIAKTDKQDLLAEIRGNYHFFRGLSAMDRGDKAAARTDLDLAFASIRGNPDVLIAMYKIAESGDYAQKVNQRIDQMVNEFRAQILSEEQSLAREPLRRERKELEDTLATSCNQLAWLLSCTERNPTEAISLSQKSLALSPNESTYLDTLGRCYFAAGELQKAIAAQSQAVEVEPFRRQMHRQLIEFQSAAAKISVAPQ